MTEITEEVVVATWNHLEHHWGSRRVNKSDSRDMDLVARFLDQLGILDAEKFLTHYTTTIENVIYTPFVVGDASTMPLKDQLHKCLHEHQHVEQWRKGRGLFLLEYMTDQDKRAGYEAEALQVNMELAHWLGDSLDLDLEHLRDYALEDKHIATVSKILSMAKKAISKGGRTTAVGRFIMPWLNIFPR